MAKILLVEDDNNLSEIYQARMVAEGYTVVAAHDGEEALALAAKEKPDLIISDVMMPKISGFEMLDILRNTQGLKETKVIMLTALGQAEDKTRADALGADRYLIKSQVTLEDIVKTAQELLSSTAAPTATAPSAAGTQPAATASPAVATTPAVPAATPVAAARPTVAMPVAQAPPVTTAVTDPIPAPVTPAAATPAATPPPEATPVAPVETPVMTTPITPTTADDTPVATSDATPTAEPDSAPAAPAEPTPPTQSAQQESAAVQDQIASFESQPAAPAASAEPAAETPETPAPEAVSTPDAAPAPAPAPVADDPSVTADNKLVADAVSDLMSNATGATPPATTEAPVITPTAPQPPAADDTTTAAPTDPPVEQAAPAVTPDASSTIADSAPIARKKIIQPISGEATKPDIGSLLAAEEAKGGQTTAPTLPTPPVADATPTPPPHQPGNVFTPTVGSSPSNGNDTGIDPNSIAL